MKLVVALEDGFYGGMRRRRGTTFTMDDSRWTKKDKTTGAIKPPRWVQVVGSEAEGSKVAAKAEADANAKAKAAAVAASGGAAAKQKHDNARDLAG